MEKIEEKIKEQKEPEKKKRGRPPGAKTGRPEVYNEVMVHYICRELMKGRTLTNICKEKRTPSLPTVFKWLSDETKPFLKLYTQARRIQAEIMADEIKDIADSSNNTNIKRSQLRVDSRKWLAAHLLPTKYSDKMQITGAEGKDLIPSVPTKVVFNLIKKEENDNSDNS